MHPGPYNIPEITPGREQELLGRLRPMILMDGVPHTIEIPDLHTVPFTWDPKVLERVEGLEAAPTIQTLHGYWYYGCFKPSIGEVLAQVPDDLPEGVIGFTVSGPDTADDLDREKGALSAGFHVADTTFWKVKD